MMMMIRDANKSFVQSDRGSTDLKLLQKLKLTHQGSAPDRGV